MGYQTTQIMPSDIEIAQRATLRPIVELARVVVWLAETTPADMRFVYDDEATLWQKAEAIAKKIYGASEVTADAKVRTQLRLLQEQGYGPLPGVHCENAILVCHRPATARRTEWPCIEYPRSAARRGRRVCRARLAATSSRCPACLSNRRRQRSTSMTTVTLSGCFED
jgi:Formate--tetrahydrofolate ligase